MREMLLNSSGRLGSLPEILLLGYRFLKNAIYAPEVMVIAVRLLHERMLWRDYPEKNVRVFLVKDALDGHYFESAYVPIKTPRSPLFDPDTKYRIGTVYDFMAMVFTIFKVVDAPLSLHAYCSIFGLDWQQLVESEYEMAANLDYGLYIDNPFNYLEDVDTDMAERVLFFMVYGDYAGLGMRDVALGCMCHYGPCPDASSAECLYRRSSLNMDYIEHIMTAPPNKIKHS